MPLPHRTRPLARHRATANRHRARLAATPPRRARRLGAGAMALGVLVAALAVTPPLAGASGDTAAQPALSPQVAHGQPVTDAGAYPWMVALLDSSVEPAAAAQYCGGALIAAGWVLTAAHCVDFWDGPGDIDVAIGQPNLELVTAADRHAVAAIIDHPGFDGTVSANDDIALLRLADPSRTADVAALALASAGPIAVGTPARVVGWGFTEGGFRPNTVRQADSAVAAGPDSPTCRNLPTPDEPDDIFFYNPATMICVYAEVPATPGAWINSCGGDSGGPLLVTENGGWAVAGLASWGSDPCGEIDFPSVYSRASSYLDWIAGHVPELFVAPDQPAAPRAVPQPGSVTVTVAAPPAGSRPTSHTVTATPGGATCVAGGAAGSCAVTGLDPDGTYTFTAVASNAGGQSPPSAPSAQVTPGPGPQRSPFGDVPAGSFFDQPTAMLALRGITTGWAGNPAVFNPAGRVSRAQMATALWRLAGSPPADTPCGFADDAAIAAWADEAACWLRDTGITTADPFRPADTVTRAQVAALLWRLAGSPPAPTSCAFADEAAIAAYARQAACWLRDTEITVLNPYRPAEPVTRAQMAAYLYRFGATAGLWTAGV